MKKTIFYSLYPKYLSLFIFILIFQNMNLYGQTKWYDPLTNVPLPVQGRGWNMEIGKAYSRLPLRAKETVHGTLWSLSQASAGLYVKFHTNAANIQIKYQVGGGLSMAHMPTTGVSGVDLYTTDADGNQYWCAGRYSFGDTINFSYENLTYSNSHGRGREYCLYLPLYNNVIYMQIGVPVGCRFEFAPVSLEKPIVVYGTSIVQGACASRPGMAWSNILQRDLDVPIINLGFSGNGLLDEEVIKLMSELDASLFVIDCMPNMGGERVRSIKDKTEKAVRLLRSKKKAPILLVEHAGYMGYKTSEQKAKDFMDTNEELQAAYHLLKDDIEELYYMTFEEIGLDMDAQVDGVHTTDLGMRQYANAYGRKIRDILCPAADSLVFKPCRQYRDANTYQWDMRHEEILRYNAEHRPEIVMIGNSITHYWGGLPFEKNRKADDVWQKLFKGKKVVNMGFGYDRLENIMWRIIHGELDNFKAKKIFMLAGTNNLQQNSDIEIVRAICQIAELIKGKQPDAQLYVMNILPRRGFETRIVQLNRLLDECLTGDSSIRILDLSLLMMNSNGTLRKDLFLDGLHPSHKGYKVIAKELRKYIN